MNAALAATLRTLQALHITVSREQVDWCFRHLLGRAPESEDVALRHARFLTFQGLVAHVASSPEYTRRRTAPASAAPRTALVPKIDLATFRRTVDEGLAARTKPVAAGEREYIEMHLQRSLDLLNLVAHFLPQGGRLVDYSAMAYFRDAVARLVPGVQHADVRGVNYELDDYAAKIGLGRFDLCLNAEVLEHLLYDPSHMVWSINRMLKPGGHLVLSTPNACSMANALRLLEGAPPSLWNQLNLTSRQYYERHNRDWTPFEVERLLREHGFEVLDTFTRDYYADTFAMITRQPERAHEIARQASHAHFGDTMIVLARKTAEVPRPVHNAWLYVLPERA